MPEARSPRTSFPGTRVSGKAPSETIRKVLTEPKPKLHEQTKRSKRPRLDLLRRQKARSKRCSDPFSDGFSRRLVNRGSRFFNESPGRCLFGTRRLDVVQILFTNRFLMETLLVLNFGCR
jgi:hypothetical protein